MPAAAVIPALIAYINVVDVKKLVVEFLALCLSWMLWDSVIAFSLRNGLLL